MPDGSWTAADAKARFGEVIDRARSDGPQRVTRNGREAVVVLSAEAYARLNGEARAESVRKVLFDPSVRGLFTDDEAEALFGRSKESALRSDVL